jgi:hypothetical protein
MMAKLSRIPDAEWYQAAGNSNEIAGETSGLCGGRHVVREIGLEVRGLDPLEEDRIKCDEIYRNRRAHCVLLVISSSPTSTLAVWDSVEEDKFGWMAETRM